MLFIKRVALAPFINSISEPSISALIKFTVSIHNLFNSSSKETTAVSKLKTSLLDSLEKKVDP